MSEDQGNRQGYRASSLGLSTGQGANKPDRREGRIREKVPTSERRAAIVPMISPSVLQGSVRMLDAFLTIVLGAAVYHGYVGDDSVVQRILYYPLIGSAAILTVLYFQLYGLYRVPVLQRAFHQMGRLFVGWSSVFLTMMVTGFLIKITDDISRVWIVSWYIAGLGAILGP